jgi:hypothetical protein
VDEWHWAYYPHSGEIESGGVYVNLLDHSVIYLWCDGYLCRTPMQGGDEKVEGEFNDEEN